MLLCDCLATYNENKKILERNFSPYKGGNLGASLRLAKDIMVSYFIRS